MKHKRIINIQNPRLKKVRNEFRKLWSAAESSEWRRFRTKMEEIGKCLTFDELKEKGVLELYLSLQGRQRRLREDFRRSICTCYACGRGDIDMYYHRRGSVLDQPSMLLVLVQ